MDFMDFFKKINDAHGHAAGANVRKALLCARNRLPRFILNDI